MRKKEAPVGENSGVPADVAEKTKEISLIDENLLKSKVYTIRGVKVMLDADLAEIYGYSTRKFNEQVKNNIEKFDADFRFQLSDAEFNQVKESILMSKNRTSSWGGTRKIPFAFTEQGIYMLMTVLRGSLATLQSKAIIRLFKDMKDYIAAENQQLLGCANCVQIAALTAQNSKEIAEIRSDFSVFKNETQESLGKVMEYFHDPSTYKHRAIVTSLNRIEHPEVYHSLMEEVLLLPDLP